MNRTIVSTWYKWYKVRNGHSFMNR